MEDLQAQVSGLQQRYDDLYTSSNTLRATLVERFTVSQHALEDKVGTAAAKMAAAKILGAPANLSV